MKKITKFYTQDIKMIRINRYLQKSDYRPLRGKKSIAMWALFILISVINLVYAQPPIGHWTFEPGEEYIDRAGNFAPITLKNAKVEDGFLFLDSAEFAYTQSYAGPDIYKEKTLICWLILDDLNALSGLPLTLEGVGRGFYDAILYSGYHQGSWNVASELWRRSWLGEGGLNEEEVGSCIQIAVVQEELNEDSVSVNIYRNGETYLSYGGYKNRTYYTGNTEVKFGFAGAKTADAYNWIDCRIEEAMIFNRALSQEEIRSLEPIKIEPENQLIWYLLGGIIVLVLLIAGMRLRSGNKKRST